MRVSHYFPLARLTDLLSADTQVNQPLLDLRADYVGMILLQIMNARRKLDKSAVCKTLRKAPAECWRDERARISHEKQFWIGRFGQRAVCFLHRGIYICRFPGDG